MQSSMDGIDANGTREWRSYAWHVSGNFKTQSHNSKIPKFKVTSTKNGTRNWYISINLS